jgi:hypothetical protein
VLSRQASHVQTPRTRPALNASLDGTAAFVPREAVAYAPETAIAEAGARIAGVSTATLSAWVDTEHRRAYEKNDTAPSYRSWLITCVHSRQ